MPPHVGPAELIIVLVVALLSSAPERLPAAGRSLGRSRREFKHSLTGATPAADEAEAAERA